MIVVMIIPTGVGAEIGGHAGDANAVAKLLGATCDTLILHPNVVNASDINEMPLNALYVEGSMLDSFLEGSIFLKTVKNNKILLAVNSPIEIDTINSISAARVTLGINAEILELTTPLQLIASFDKQGVAGGEVIGWKELVKQVMPYDFDVLAIQTAIEMPKEVGLKYIKEGGVNPWGGVEAICSRIISQELGLPVAHAPYENGINVKEIVDPRLAAEMVSVSYLYCILKGLQKAPQIGDGTSKGSISNLDVDCMVSPWGCVGRPHYACEEIGIPVIMVRENKTILDDVIPDSFIKVDNYFEAAGVILANKMGISLESIRRPISKTIVIKGD